MKNKIKHCSLFSGIGAFEKAMSNLGVDFEITSYCEINKYSSCAYAAIHGIDESLNLGDISKVKSEDIPDFNLLTWGFPCQDISIAGKQAGIEVGTRSGLYYEGYRILKDRLPKYSIIENVKNLTSKRHWGKFDMILKDLSDLGYKNYWKVLNAKDYGVPQNRERVFIVSILGDGNFEFPEGFNNGIRLKDVLESDVDEKYCVSEKVQKDFTGLEYQNRIIRNEPIRLGGLFDDGKGKHQAGVIWDKDGIAPTLDTMQGSYRQPSIIESKEQFGRMGRQAVEAYNKNGGCYGDTINPFNKSVSKNGLSPTITTRPEGFKTAILPITSSYRIRKLTPLECWRLMGFSDDDFYRAKAALMTKFYNGTDRADSQLYKMAGNSIVVDVPMAIYKTLFNIDAVKKIDDFKQGELF